MKRPIAGVTLVELLIGMALLGIVLTAVYGVFISTTQASATVQARSDLTSTTQFTLQAVSARLREAVYVYPTGTTLTLGSTYITTNPITKTQAWTVGTHPLTAFIVPPKETGTCNTTPIGQNRCYSFYAYYALNRKLLTTNAPASSNPGTQPDDDSTWVMMQYRSVFTTTPTLTAPPAIPGSPQIALIGDNLQDKTGNTWNAPFKTLPPAPGTAATAVAITLRAERRLADTTIVIPSPSSAYSITVYPRNLGKAAP